jgi:hypothetical protein
MASWKYADDSNLGEVTLGSAYTAADGTMSLTAGHGARLPSEGDFWLGYDTGAGMRIFKVTARSTDTLTITPDATEGLGDGSIASGQTLRPVVSNAAIDQLKYDSGAWVLLDTQVASSSASLDFTSKITSDFDNYVVQLQNVIPATNTATLRMQVSIDNGANWVTAAASYAWHGWNSNTGGGAQAGSLSDTGMGIFSSMSNGTLYGGSGTFYLYAPLNTSQRFYFNGTGFYFTSASLLNVVNGYGAYLALTAVDAIRFLYSSGNIASGTIRLYGIRK